MDELFWGWDHEDINDWAKKLTMVIEMQDLNVDKFFKTTKLYLKRRAKEWFKILNPTPTDWTELRILIIQKYEDDNVNDI
jgi:hypothetical protein